VLNISIIYLAVISCANSLKNTWLHLGF